MAKSMSSRSGVSIRFNLGGLAADQNLVWLFIGAVVIFVAMSILSPRVFLSSANLSSMAYQFPQAGLLALGILVAMLSGGIDLSMVGIANLTSIVAALVLTRWLPADAGPAQVFLYSVLAGVLGMLTGLVCGALNGFVIAKVGVSPILATLGSMQLFTGIAIIITKGNPIYGVPPAFNQALSGTLLGIPVPVLIFAVSALAVSVVLNRTALGVKWYMLGTNVTAARFSGIKVETLQMQSYIVAGGLAALAGLLILAQTNSAKADYGVSYTLQSILIAVMGGVNPYGGFGKVTGVVLAIMILQFLSSGFNILGFNSFLKDFIWGASLLVVMMVNYLSHERQIKRASAASKN